jgi:hypothetical protein
MPDEITVAQAMARLSEFGGSFPYTLRCPQCGREGLAVTFQGEPKPEQLCLQCRSEQEVDDHAS